MSITIPFYEEIHRMQHIKIQLNPSSFQNKEGMTVSGQTPDREFPIGL